MKCQMCLNLFSTWLFVFMLTRESIGEPPPLVVSTWYTKKFGAAAQKAWDMLMVQQSSRMEALVSGLQECEKLQCDFTVGYGGSPDEVETTLDSLIMDGPQHLSGAVAALRRVKHAARVAWAVMNYTRHSLLVGEKATHFAISMGFKEESLSTDKSRKVHAAWLENNCQPNFWKNVSPDPQEQCGPYKPNNVEESEMNDFCRNHYAVENGMKSHDTMGLIVIDGNGDISAGTSSNGATHKIAGRVGDAPIIGSGAFVDNKIGAAVATGDGDTMMRFSPSFLAVELMRQSNMTPSSAAEEAIRRIGQHYPNFFGALVVANRKGEFGAACSGMPKGFSYSVVQKSSNGKVLSQHVKCLLDIQPSEQDFSLFSN